ncbi:MAG: VWA domain-containing protein [Lentimicrobiaceae bacterium]|nr:VWA domain-containing protein [Lentimicrobiaceae bacterium]MCB9024284.1 VWA domain-containing protein [Lentimicrobiaceae bacterium]MCO5264751.1 VWA domain-containing protein [Lentimicrobium sp.]
MKPQHKVFNLIILDESGSMQSIKHDIIQGFNEVVQTIKGVEKQYPEQQHIISLLTFNGLGRKYLLENMPVSELSEINENQFMPDASTPLYDAIGFSIGKLRAYLANESDYNVLVTILTDGEENSSKEYKGRDIKQLVEELELQNWTFTYIGADHDVKKFALSISITNSIIFEKEPEKMNQMFHQEKEARLRFSQKIRNHEKLTDNFYDNDENT